MMTRIGVGLCVAGLLAVAPQPAAAQMVDDFMCSTFSYKCHPNPTLPPPQLAPGTAPVAAPAKHASKAHKRAKRTAAKADTAAPAPAPADAAAPK